MIMITFVLKTRTLIPRGCEDTSFDETRLGSYSDCLKFRDVFLDELLRLSSECEVVLIWL